MKSNELEICFTCPISSFQAFDDTFFAIVLYVLAESFTNFYVKIQESSSTQRCI